MTKWGLQEPKPGHVNVKISYRLTNSGPLGLKENGLTRNRIGLGGPQPFLEAQKPTYINKNYSPTPPTPTRRRTGGLKPANGLENRSADTKAAYSLHKSWAAEPTDRLKDQAIAANHLQPAAK